MICPFFPQRFVAQGDDTGIYWVRQNNEKSTIWWYAEHREFLWAHVYRGKLITEHGVCRWEGSFIDVPKGLTCSHGNSLNWQVENLGSAFFLNRTAASGGSGGHQIVPLRDVPSAEVTRLNAGFVGSGIDNLTGVWIGDDNGTYYIREVSETGQIAWVGENPAAVPGLEDQAGLAWVNVLMGSRSQRIITAEWSDVPKGEINSSGEMTLAVENANLITILSKSGGFGGNSFTRIGEFSVSLRFVSLTVVDQQEWFFEGDEPYFLALIAVMDGNTVNLNRPSTAAANFSNSLVAPKLRDNVGAGTVISLSSMAPVSINLLPVPGDTGSHPILGLAIRGAEQDWSGPEWRADRLRDWIATGGGELNRALRTGSVSFRTNIARWHETWTWRDEDDIFGLATSTFTYPELVAMAGSTTRLTFRLSGGGAAYDLRVDLSVTGARGTCRP